MSLSGRVLIYGSCGALGKVLSEVFRKNNWHVIGCDFAKSEYAHTSLVAESNQNVLQQGEQILSSLQGVVTKEVPIDAILCASGGFAAGNAGHSQFLQSSHDMITSSIYPALICAKVAAIYLKKNGLLVLPGADAAFHPTPALLGYGSAKAYVHSLVKSLAAEGSGLPEGSKVIGIAPVTLDTPGNRVAMPHSDTSSWTPLDDLSRQLLHWSMFPQKVKNGKIFRILTEKGTTKYTAIL